MPASLSVETFSLATRQRVSGPDDISLPSETSHRDVAVHDEVFFASGRSGRWYAQTKNGNRRLWLSRSRPHFLAGSGMLLPVQACVRLLAGVVLELRAQSSESPGGPGPLRSLTVSAMEDFVLAGTQRGTLLVWSTRTSEGDTRLREQERAEQMSVWGQIGANGLSMDVLGQGGGA